MKRTCPCNQHAACQLTAPRAGERSKSITRLQNSGRGTHFGTGVSKWDSLLNDSYSVRLTTVILAG